MISHGNQSREFICEYRGEKSFLNQITPVVQQPFL